MVSLRDYSFKRRINESLIRPQPSDITGTNLIHRDNRDDTEIRISQFSLLQDVKR